MIAITPGLYVTIEQLETPLAPVPKPLQHAFSTDTAYLVLGAFSLSESGDAYFILSNNEDQIWFISNRHLRTYELRPAATAFRIPRGSHSQSETPRHSLHLAALPADEPYPGNGALR